jgi:hypothetical protein
MAEHSLHPTDALQDAIDGRLDAASRAALDLHLEVCPACRRELEALAWVKQQVGDHARDAEPVPADLQATILRALDAEDRGAADVRLPASSDRRGGPERWWIGALAAAAAVVALVWLGMRPTGVATPILVAEDFRAYAAGRLALERRTAVPAELEARLQASALPFRARVFDFGMMDYGLDGGGLHQVAGQPSALFAYTGRGALRVLCQMYEGAVADLPPPEDRRTDNGIEFLVYREGDVTVVFWQEEGGVVCVLAANGDAEAAIRLAFAKAVRL